MTLPRPEPGLVISYAYLWYEEAQSGREEASKDRPCAIILTTEEGEGETIVTLVPITHTPPNDPDAAVEIPRATKRRLGLDDARSWVVISETNRFIWPGPDLRPIHRHTNEVAYGFPATQILPAGARPARDALPCQAAQEHKANRVVAVEQGADVQAEGRGKQAGERTAQIRMRFRIARFGLPL